MDSRNPPAVKCKFGCARCPELTGEPMPDVPGGWRLVLPALGAFLGPAALAIAGMYALPALWVHPYSQAAGGTGGLALGMALAAMVSALLRKRTRRHEFNNGCVSR